MKLVIVAIAAGCWFALASLPGLAVKFDNVGKEMPKVERTSQGGAIVWKGNKR